MSALSSGFSRRLKQTLASWGWHASARMRRPGCIVLMYHRIGLPSDPFPHLDADKFRRQLQWLAGNCQVIGPAALRESAGRPPETRTPVLLTFDDATRDYHDLAYPLLKQFGMPAVVFPISDYVDHPRLPWWDRLHLSVYRARVDRVSLPWQPDRCVRLGGPRNPAFIAECKRHLKSVPDETKERLVDELVRLLGSPAIDDVGRQLMTWNEIRATLDLTTYGGHTHTHPLMPRIDASRADVEIRTCRERIAAETGVAPTVFAYPNGDFTHEAKALLARHGFEIAFTTQSGINDDTTDWLEVKRVGVGNIVPTVWMTTQSWKLMPSPAAHVPA